METPEQYNLSWKNFRECTTSTFRDLLRVQVFFNLNSSWARPLLLRYKNQNRFTSSAQEFSDVTLVCDDDKQVSAHKVSLDPIHRSSV